MRRLGRSIRADWPKLVTELAVVILGISISLGVDEWRRDREDTLAARRTWESIADDLKADSAYLAGRVVQLDRMVKSYDGLLGTAPPDSLDAFMDRAISYVVFTPTQSAYRELHTAVASADEDHAARSA